MTSSCFSLTTYCLSLNKSWENYDYFSNVIKILQKFWKCYYRLFQRIFCFFYVRQNSTKRNISISFKSNNSLECHMYRFDTAFQIFSYTLYRISITYPKIFIEIYVSWMCHLKLEWRTVRARLKRSTLYWPRGWGQRFQNIIHICMSVSPNKLY